MLIQTYEFFFKRMIRQKSFYKCIFDICRLISQIIRSLKNIGQRMTAVPCLRLLRDLLKYLLICQKISHLLFSDIPGIRMDLCGRNRIFYNRIEQCIGQIHPVLIHQIMKSRYQSECLCISLKMIEVLFHLRTQYHIQSLSLIMQFGKLPHKPVPDRQLPEMPERRTADIMDQPGTFQNMRNILLHLPGKLLIRSTLQDCFTDILSQRLGKRRHFQRMRQSCPYKIALIQRKYLRLILQSPK